MTPPLVPDARSTAPSTLTEYLLSRSRPHPPAMGAVVIYGAASDLDDTDPRRHTLTFTTTAAAQVNQTVGFGRSPRHVDIPIVVGGAGDLIDLSVPRTAAYLHRTHHGWHISNKSSQDAVITISAPGQTITVRSGEPPVQLRADRQIVCLHAPSPARSGHPVMIEHRLTVILPEYLGQARHPLPLPDSLEPSATLSTDPPAWDRQTARTLVANYYPHLVGLPPHTYAQEAMADLIMGLPPKPPRDSKNNPANSRHEKILKRARDQAERAVHLPMSGKEGTGRFVQYLLHHRDRLEPTLVDLHAEYAAQHR